MTLIPNQIKCERKHRYGVSILIAEIELDEDSIEILLGKITD